MGRPLREKKRARRLKLKKKIQNVSEGITTDSADICKLIEEYYE